MKFKTYTHVILQSIILISTIFIVYIVYKINFKKQDEIVKISVEALPNRKFISKGIDITKKLSLYLQSKQDTENLDVIRLFEDNGFICQTKTKCYFEDYVDGVKKRIGVDFDENLTIIYAYILNGNC